jgi:hypothetical protein
VAAAAVWHFKSTFLSIQHPAMSDSFDPYYIWLGIPPKDQPPNHYRLLGIQELEENMDVIDAAANRQTTYLHEMAAGPHRKESQQLLNELAGARRCLLNPEHKRQYDAKLLAERASVEAAAVPVAQAVTSPVPLIDTGEIPGSELPDFDFSAGAASEVEPGTDTALAANSQPNQHAPQQKLPAKSGALDAREDGAVPGKPIPRQWIITGCSVVVVAIIAFVFINGSDTARKKQPTSTSTQLDDSGGTVTLPGSGYASPVTSEEESGPADDGRSLFDQIDVSESSIKAPQQFGGKEKQAKKKK